VKVEQFYFVLKNIVMFLPRRHLQKVEKYFAVRSINNFKNNSQEFENEKHFNKSLW